MDTSAFTGPVVVGIDGSEQSTRASVLGRAIARGFHTDVVHIHSVRDKWAAVREVALAAAATASATPRPVTRWSKPLSAEERQAAEEQVRHNVPEGTRIVVEEGRPSTVLSRYAHEHDASLLIVGGKHHGTLGRWVVGSTASELVRSCQTPVLVVGDPPSTLSRILVALDLSVWAPAILNFAQQLAANTESALFAIHVVSDNPLPADSGMTYEQLLAGSKSLAQERLWDNITLPNVEYAVAEGAPGACIRAYAEQWDVDLIIVGSHGHGFDGRMLLGGTTEGLIDDLPTSVLVYPVE